MINQGNHRGKQMSMRVLCTQSQQSLAEFSILVTANTNLL